MGYQYEPTPQNIADYLRKQGRFDPSQPMEDTMLAEPDPDMEHFQALGNMARGWELPYDKMRPSENVMVHHPHERISPGHAAFDPRNPEAYSPPQELTEAMFRKYDVPGQVMRQADANRERYGGYPLDPQMSQDIEDAAAQIRAGKPHDPMTQFMRDLGLDKY